MFDLFSWSHIVILLVVALVVVGPKDLPRLMHMAGKWAGKARAMANEFRKSFDEMARQAELDELRKEIEDLKKNNPVSDMMGAMNDATASINNSVTEGIDGAGISADVTAPVEGAIEPRSGEFEVTDTAAAPVPPAGPAAP
ncbi:MAG TPA: Sec-independent protein translocase protein TatB [Rhizomicrobium sp.]|nr:Sec-independent protein translocase protein TatB [Rhizomicrobium sp.]